MYTQESFSGALTVQCRVWWRGRKRQTPERRSRRWLWLKNETKSSKIRTLNLTNVRTTGLTTGPPRCHYIWIQFISPPQVVSPVLTEIFCAIIRPPSTARPVHKQCPSVPPTATPNGSWFGFEKETWRSGVFFPSCLNTSVTRFHHDRVQSKTWCIIILVLCCKQI